MCDACLSPPEPLAAEYFCRQCRAPFQNRFPLDEQGRCALCSSGATTYDAAYCYGVYGGALLRLVHLLKYSRMKPLAKPLARLLLSALPLDREYDAVVPVPLHWRRAWQRGFNQSKLLAREIARGRGLRMMEPVRRVRATRSQTGLTSAERRRNVAHAFRVKRGKSLEGLRILLVDDVMTTSATVNACAGVLKRAGAKSVTVLTLARADRRGGAS